jgi:selenocysteine lyase/cysteine desulfurase
VGLADAFRSGLGMPPAGSAIVSVRREGAGERLAAAGVVGAARAGAARLSFHLYSTEDDVARALDALA